MEITEPNKKGFTVYGKSGCINFIENIAETSYKPFPMVFYDGKFVGGLTHTKEFINKLLLSFEDKF